MFNIYLLIAVVTALTAAFFYIKKLGKDQEKLKGLKDAKKAKKIRDSVSNMSVRELRDRLSKLIK